MKTFSIVIAALVVVAVQASIVDDINSMQSQWTAKENDHQGGKFFGVIPKTHDSELPRVTYDGRVSVPDEFDSRKAFPGCIGPVLNQADCGSCWAFGAAEAISDRLCISQTQKGANGTFVQLAPLDLVANDYGAFGNNGCQGGQLESAWEYVKEYGLVTESCMPYGKWETPVAGPIPTCPPSQQPCLNFVSTPSKESTCVNGADFQGDKHKISNVYSVSGEQDMMAEIMKNGPIESAFSVYSDFLKYDTGVYKHVTGQMEGGHAIKIIGWGVENGVKYWLVQNSWTTSWAGLGGYFKIQRGTDECGIESQGVAGTF